MANISNYNSYGDMSSYPLHTVSPPIKVEFAGWVSDTYTLQQNGWQLSANQDIMNRTIRVAIQHQEYKIRGLSPHISFEIYQMFNRDDFNRNYINDMTIPFRLASDFVVNSQEIKLGLKPIDAMPQVLDRMPQKLSEMNVFAPNLMRTQEIIIPEYEVNDLLAMILEKQQASREKIIMDKVRSEGYEEIVSPRQNVHAQIISLAA